MVDVGCLPLPGVIVRLGAQATVTDERGHFAVVANESPAVLTARLEGFRRGRVLDAQCRPLSGATVRALSERQIRRTDADGRFEFTSITSGSPAIEVIATGFVTTEVKDVRMDEKNTGYVDVPMDVGVVRDRVTVSGR